MKEGVSEEDIMKMHADLCKMLSNPTRLKILEELKEDEKRVGELVDSTGLSQSNVSQHLGELRKRDLVESRKDGASVYYKIKYPRIMDACEIVKEVLFERLSDDKELYERGV